MAKLIWKPHVIYAAYVFCGLLVFHIVGFISEQFPTSVFELLNLALVFFLVPCLAFGILYSICFRKCWSAQFNNYSDSKFFVISGFIQGSSVYPISVKVANLSLFNSTTIGSLIGGILLVNVLSLVFPIILALLFIKISSFKCD